MAGLNKAIITNKQNLLCGIYNDTDATSVDVIREGHYDLSFASDIWLGFQFHTIDPRRFRYVEFGEPEDKPKQNEPEQGGENKNGE